MIVDSVLGGMIGRRLRELRLELGRSIEEVAHDLNMSFSALAMYERGERTPPLQKLEQLAEYYGTTVAYLIGETSLRSKHELREAAFHYRERLRDPDACIPQTTLERAKRIRDELTRLIETIQDEQDA